MFFHPPPMSEFIIKVMLSSVVERGKFSSCSSRRMIWFRSLAESDCRPPGLLVVLVFVFVFKEVGISI